MARRARELKRQIRRPRPGTGTRSRNARRLRGSRPALSCGPGLRRRWSLSGLRTPLPGSGFRPTGLLRPAGTPPVISLTVLASVASLDIVDITRTEADAIWFPLKAAPEAAKRRWRFTQPLIRASDAHPGRRARSRSRLQTSQPGTHARRPRTPPAVRRECLQKGVARCEPGLPCPPSL